MNQEEFGKFFRDFFKDRDFSDNNKKDRQKELHLLLDCLLAKLKFETFKSDNSNNISSTQISYQTLIYYTFLDGSILTFILDKSSYETSFKIRYTYHREEYNITLNNEYSQAFLDILSVYLDKSKKEKKRQKRSKYDYDYYEDYKRFWDQFDWSKNERKSTYTKSEPKINVGYTRVYSGGTSTSRKRYNLLVERLEIQYTTMQKKMKTGEDYGELERDITLITSKLDRMKDKYNF